MAVEELTVAPRADLFRPGRRDGRELLLAAWAPATAASHASCMKQYFRFCEEERRPAMAADPGTMARYVTWLGNMGTIKASSLQPYRSAVNDLFKDHGREPMALGDLVIKSPTAGDGTYLGQGAKYRVHRDRKGKRGPDARKKLLCQLPASPHADIVESLHYLDAARQVFAGGRVPAARWAISQREGQAKWMADTLTSWLQLKIKYFSGWALESIVVLAYINPTVLPCPAAWHLFGWMTPWGGQPARLPRQVAT
eukprot:jgi/Tetstr1/466570/TSEL_011072.t1